MNNKTITFLISLLFVFSGINIHLIDDTNARQEQKSTEFSFSYLSEDTITYFQVPKDAVLTILYDHVWAYGNASFNIYDEYGQIYSSVQFSYEEQYPTESITFDKQGVYKMVATGVNFRYEMHFSGPEYEYKCVAAAMPHKAMYRVKDNEITKAYVPVSNKKISFHITNDYTIPARDATIKFYNEKHDLLHTVYMDSTDFDQSYLKTINITRNDDTFAFFQIEIEGHGGGQSRVVVWTNQSHTDLPTNHGTLITPDPSLFFIPRFKSRTVSIDHSEQDHQALVGSSGYVVNQTANSSLYNQYVKQLQLSISKQWVSWRWRERQGTNTINDDDDPFHINWDGFDMDPFDQRMQYFVYHQIKPILCLQWDPSAFISENPALWEQNEIDEFAEFCLAMAIHCVAPDLKEPTSDRNPYEILGIMPFNEPNLIFNEVLALEESADAYVNILKTIGQRFKNHPDPRINQLPFVVPGSTMHIYAEQELSHWITTIIEEAAEFADIIVWDQYSYYLLEELPNYKTDVSRVQNILNNAGITRSLGLSEFGIHGGIPTSQEFYGSRFAKLYVFGALANSINAGMKYPVYFTLIDPIHEPRQKGLITGISSYPPYSDLPSIQPKPQYYAMQIVSKLCTGSILSISNNCDQIDVLASKNESIYQFALSNRYENETTVNIPVPEDVTVEIYEVADKGIIWLENKTSNGMISITIPAWSIYYLSTEEYNQDSKADLKVSGNLNWRKVRPESTVTATITIRNDGDKDSFLNWKISEYPDWGTWTFSEMEGFDLTPQQGENQINITLIVPEEKNEEYNKYIKVINTNDPHDYEIISVRLSTPRSIFLDFQSLMKSLYPLAHQLLRFLI